jgi:hypothetical protein
MPWHALHSASVSVGGLQVTCIQAHKRSLLEACQLSHLPSESLCEASLTLNTSPLPAPAVSSVPAYPVFCHLLVRKVQLIVSCFHIPYFTRIARNAAQDTFSRLCVGTKHFSGRYVLDLNSCTAYEKSIVMICYVHCALLKNVRLYGRLPSKMYRN